MINNYERKIVEMQDQIEVLSQFVTGDWQHYEIHDVEEKIFRAFAPY